MMEPDASSICSAIGAAVRRGAGFSPEARWCRVAVGPGTTNTDSLSDSPAGSIYRVPDLPVAAEPHGGRVQAVGAAGYG